MDGDETRIEEANAQAFSIDKVDPEGEPEQKVFGPFWRLAIAMGLVSPIHNAGNRVVPTLIGWVGVVPILARTVWLGSGMGQLQLWSEDWAYTTLLFTFSLHAFVCFVMLKVFEGRRFFQKFLDQIVEASGNRIFHREKRTWLRFSLLSAVLVFFLYSMLWFTLDNMVTREVNGTAAVAHFRRSMFGENYLQPLDTLIMLWSALVSSVVLVLVFLLNSAMLRQYTYFHEEVRALSWDNREDKQGVADGTLMRKTVRASSSQPSSSTPTDHLPLLDANTLSAFDSRLIHFLSLIKHSNETTEPLITISFLSAFFSYVISVFAVRMFKAEFRLQSVTFYNWIGLSLMFVFISLVPLAKLHSKIRETKNLVLLEKGIWREYDEKMYSLAWNIVGRIEKVDYESRLFSAIRVTSAFFNLVLLIVPFFVDYVLAPMR